METENKESKRLIDRFMYAYSNRQKVFDERHQRNEFYYSDVDGTLSQLTEYQQEFIKNSYNIPISTKLTYPIIEQMLAFLTGSKPYPRLVSSNEKTKEFTETMTKAFYGVWYESKADDELKTSIKDALVVGSGFIRVRDNSFFEESTFNTLVEHVPWHTVFVDPQSREADFSDAEFIVVANIMTISKAEKTYDIKVNVDDGQDYPTNVFAKMNDIELKEYWGINGYKNGLSEKWVIVLEFFEKKDNNVYISDDGQISAKKPEQIEIPNPDKMKLSEKIDVMLQAETELKGNLDNSNQDQESLEGKESFDDAQQYNEAVETQQGTQDQSKQMLMQLQALQKQIRQLQITFTQMPDKVNAYKMTTLREEEVIIMSYDTIKKKQIKRTIMVNDTIVEKDTLTSNKYPIHHIYIDHNGSPNKTYGIVHKIKDLVKAMNKFWSAMLFDVMSNNNRKVFYPKGSMVEISDIERKWNTPGGAFIGYDPDPTDVNGGMPKVIEPSPLNQTYPSLLGMLQQLIEYITGIQGIMMGDNSGSSKTFGGIQSLQSFGSQRIKLYARNIEHTLTDLAYNIVTHLQQHAPQDKVLLYFDDNQDAQEIKILKDFQDINFKVRVDITNSLPTQRQAAVQLLGMIAQTTSDPQIAKLYTEMMLKYMDMPEGDEVLQKVDTITQMQQQMAQLQQQLQQSEGLNKSLQHNMSEMQANKEIDQAKSKAMANIQTEEAVQKQALQPPEEPEQEQEEFYQPEQGEL